MAANSAPELLLPAPLRIDVATATDAELLDAVAALVEAYLDGLVFQQDASGDFSGSPFDAFLARNGLPRHADPGESARDCDVGPPCWRCELPVKASIQEVTLDNRTQCVPIGTH